MKLTLCFHCNLPYKSWKIIYEKLSKKYNENSFATFHCSLAEFMRYY